MDVTADLDAPHPPGAVFALVEDLARYPTWLDIVPRVVGEPDGAWLVDLRGRLGPFARSKRLRMVRSRHEPPRTVRFERAELDGRSHSEWILDATVEALGTGSRLTMHLHYGGGLFGPVLEKVLGDEIERSRPRLLAALGERSHGDG
ncbi:MAG TPA: SRPBCC family protein [Acidimicrobiales bacterium]|nr:SRPBCC family protein [Acidimicrobiales bacterium]